MKKIDLRELLESGVHFGHQKKRWHPKMKPFIFGMRNGVYIINLEETAKKLEEAAQYAQDIAKKGGKILFVGTKKQAKDIVKAGAEKAGMPFITERWLGGVFTNFDSISRLFKKLKKMKNDKEKGRFEKYTKKEQLLFRREIDRLEGLIGGAADLRTIPDAIFVVDIKHESIAVTEARKKGVPVIAVTDTNTNPELVTKPIPANDDATRAIEYITSYMADAILEGVKNQEKPVVQKPVAKKTVKAPVKKAAETEQDAKKTTTKKS